MRTLFTRLAFLKLFSQSVFMRVAVLLAVSIAVVSSTQMLLSIRSALRIVDDGVRLQGEQVTGFVADEAAGAIKFGKSDALQGLFDRAIASAAGSAETALAVDGSGNLLLSVGTADVTALAELVRLAIERDETLRSADGFLIAQPSHSGGERAVVGGVGMNWTPAPQRARVLADQQRTAAFAGGLFLLILLFSVLILRATVSRPLLEVNRAMQAIAAAEYAVEIPGRERRDEIGGIAKTLDSFRNSLAKAAVSARENLFKGAGFEGSSAALMLTDTALRITYVNASLQELMQAQGRPAAVLAGADFDVFGAVPDALRVRLAEPANLPLSAELTVGERCLALEVNGVPDPDQRLVGYVLEWQDVTAQRRNSAILGALDGGQLRAELTADGTIRDVNAGLADMLGTPESALIGRPAAALLRLDGADGPAGIGLALANRVSTPARIRVARTGRPEGVLEGSLTPILGPDGAITGHVLIGIDATEAHQALAAAEASRLQMQTGQTRVVEVLRGELCKLSGGDLTCTIAEVFAEDYEQLRTSFNTAVAGLREAVTVVLDHVDTIASESRSITGAADDLSRRTETQAATLEETVASLGLITQNVKGAADGARRANQVVVEARSSAESSGRVIRDAVQAMAEIESSSGQISKIIGVIDDISFQTNLLALNAGVEAARAGSAGRGFAVVATEVRALAQRSSEAAREISALISSSGEQVTRGVALVRDAGQALDGIVGSVADIATHVAGIARAAEEQSVSLDEINVAMQQLDEVTQKNAAMFEETTAASHALGAEAETLNRTMGRFRVRADQMIEAPDGPGEEVLEFVTANQASAAEFRRALG